jgi:hypothetical protein
MASLLCTKHVRDYALNTASAKARGFKRVSPAFLNRLDAQLRQIIEREVQSHPSVGVTLK